MIVIMEVPCLLVFLVDFAVIVTTPGESVETRPELLTVARAVLLLLQVTLCGAPEGDTVAVSCFVPPAPTDVLLGLTVTPVGATVGL